MRLPRSGAFLFAFGADTPLEVEIMRKSLKIKCNTYTYTHLSVRPSSVFVLLLSYSLYCMCFTVAMVTGDPVRRTKTQIHPNGAFFFVHQQPFCSHCFRFSNLVGGRAYIVVVFFLLSSPDCVTSTVSCAALNESLQAQRTRG